MTDDIDIEKRIGAHVRRRRLDAGLTQEDLGRKVGVSYQQIQKYETGMNRIAVSTLMRIAAAMNTTTAELVEAVEKV